MELAFKEVIHAKIKLVIRAKIKCYKEIIIKYGSVMESS